MSTHRRIVVAAVIAVALAVAAVIVWGSDGAIIIAGAATAAATGVLAWFTARLAVVTKTMAPEPAVVATFAYFAANVFLDLHNAGNGAAVDIDVTIEWNMTANVDNLSVDPTRWRSSLLPAGALVRFNPPQLPGLGHLQGDLLPAFKSVAVSGTMRNERGDARVIDTAITEPGELYRLEADARRQYSSNYDPFEIATSELPKVRKALEAVSEHLASLVETQAAERPSKND